MEVILGPEEDRVGSSLRVQTWAPSFSEAWDFRVMGALEPQNGPMVEYLKAESLQNYGERAGRLVLKCHRLEQFYSQVMIS